MSSRVVKGLIVILNKKYHMLTLRAQHARDVTIERILNYYFLYSGFV